MELKLMMAEHHSFERMRCRPLADDSHRSRAASQQRTSIEGSHQFEEGISESEQIEYGSNIV